MTPQHQASTLFDNVTRQNIGAAIRLMTTKPRHASRLSAILTEQGKRQKIRESTADNLSAPPLMIISLTRQCNLRCSGCYSNEAVCSETSVEMTPLEFRKLLSEAEQLGVATFMLAGGEPLMRQDLLDVAAEFPESLFLIFSNGQLFDSAAIRFFHQNPHLIPILSVEGGQAETDARRGDGTYAVLTNTMQLLQQQRAVFGVSVTATTQNRGYITSDAFAQSLMQKGADVFFFVEYVPQGDDDRHLALGDQEKLALSAAALALQSKHKGLFIAFPGDETVYDGCLAAGRGFIHIGPDGSVTPCPFAQMHDTNAIRDGLGRALQSPLLAVIREHHQELTETRGGCALAANKDLVASWLKG